MKKLISALTACAFLSSFAAIKTVTVDESGDIQPQEASQAIKNAASAVVRINMATAEATVLTNVVAIANQTIEECNDLLTRYDDHVVIDLYATGLEDATGQTSNAEEYKIAIVGNPVVDSTSDPSNNLVKLTWQYVSGTFTNPEIMAATALSSNDVFTAVSMTAPVQVSLGGVATNVAYQSTASISKALYGNVAFFKIEARPNVPVDDGRVFDMYSDGPSFTVRLVPNKMYDMTVLGGRLISVTEVNE